MARTAADIQVAERIRWAPAVVLGVAAALSVRLYFYVHRYAVDLLFWDQWDILDDFFHGDPPIGNLFFLQFGPHREGVGLIPDKYLYPLTHWSSRFEAFMLAGSLVLAMLLALQLKRRLFGRLAYTDAVVPVLFLPLSQFENLIGPLNPAHSIFPLLLVIIYCHVLLIQRPMWRYGLLLVVNFMMIYTGFAIFMGIVTIGVFIAAGVRQVRGLESVPAALLWAGLAIACLSLASYFIDYIFKPFVGCYEFPWHQPSDYPQFMTGMFDAATRVGRDIRTLTGALLLAGTVLLTIVCGWRALGASAKNRTPLVIAVLAGYSLIFAANTAVGRVCLGIGASQASRYSTLLIPAFLAIYLFLCTLSKPWLHYASVTLLALLFVRAHRLDPAMPALAEIKRRWAECYRQFEDIERCDTAAGFRIHPEPERTHLKEKLDFLKERRLNLFRDAG